MPFYCGKRSADICVVLGPKQSSTYSSEYACVFFEPAASHLPTSPFPRNEGLLGQAPGKRPLDQRSDKINVQPVFCPGHCLKLVRPQPLTVILSEHPPHLCSLSQAG